MGEGSPLTVEGVGKSFKGFIRRVPALRDVSLDLRPGEIVGLVGPNGAGKSTLFLVALGYLFPDRGRVSLFGGDPLLPAIRSRIGWVPEHPIFFQGDTGHSFLYRSLRGHGWSRSDALLRTSELLARFGLAEAARRSVRTYSRGMMQKAALAHSIAHRPSLLILDEPTSGMDPLAVLQVREELRAFRASGGAAFVSSHQLNELTRICDRVLFLFGGEIQREERLAGTGRPRRLAVAVENVRAAEELLGIQPPSVIAAWRRVDEEFVIDLAEGGSAPGIAAALIGAGLLSLREDTADLESIYAEMGGGKPC
jgi:ABC-2 type transport system ATP-binding protein